MKKNVFTYRKTIVQSVVLLLGMWASTSQAQGMMEVTERSNWRSYFTISDIKKITFNQGKMTIIPQGNFPASFTNDAIKVITFGAVITDISHAVTEIQDQIYLFPNPAVNYLNIGLASVNDTELISVKIISTSGSVVYTGIIDNHSGIDISAIVSGVYVCQIIAGEDVRTIKFIKN